MKRGTMLVVFLGLLLLGVGWITGFLVANRKQTGRYQLLSLAERKRYFKERGGLEPVADDRTYIFLLDTQTGETKDWDGRTFGFPALGSKGRP